MVESESSLSEKGRRYLSLAKEEIHRIAQIASGALKPKSTSPSQKTNVAALLHSVIDLHESAFKARGISIETRYCVDGAVPAFAGPLRQAFSNLMLNAADSMPNGGTVHARISPTHEWTGQERHGLRVTFGDNGAGIPAGNLPHIYDLFFTTKGDSGTGLGLSQVKSAVAKHDGVLRVRTTTRRGRSGTVFAMFLPAHIGLVV